MASKKQQKNYEDILKEIEALTAQKNIVKNRIAGVLGSAMTDASASLLSPLTDAQLGRVMALLEPYVAGCVEEVMAGTKPRVKAREKAPEQAPGTDSDEIAAIGLIRRDEDLKRAMEGDGDHAET